MSFTPGSITFPEVVNVPDNPPAAGKYFLYARSSTFKYMDSTGTEYTLASAGPSSLWIQEIITVTEQMLLDGQLTLSDVPLGTVALTPVGGPAQIATIDYNVSGSIVTWTGMGLDGILESGDKLVFYYEKEV
jgi:hypothetical protein